jgi:integrase
MAKLPGLFRRGSTFYLRVVIPLDLRGLYGTTKIIRSLGTRDASEAKHTGAKHRAEALHAFARELGHCQKRAVFPWSIQQQGAVTVRPPLERSGQLVTLRDVHSRWQVSARRSRDSINACLRAVQLFEEFSEAPMSVHSIDRDLGDRFRAWLLMPDRGTTAKTARDRFTWVKSLLKYANQDLEVLSKSPWLGLDIDASTTLQRRPWTPKELNTFFLRPLFMRYELPSDRKAGADAAYWVPLLGLFTGARIGELAQLRTDDVEEGEVPSIRISGDGAGQKVKTAASVRRVPIHNELIRLGFLEYVKTQRKANAGSLWPLLPQRDGKPGGYLSQWFGEERKAAGLTDTYPDFHCFRHTVRTQLAEASLPEPLIDCLIGHETKGSTGARVYTHRSMQALREAINTLKYSHLTMKLCYNTKRASWGEIKAQEV